MRGLSKLSLKSQGNWTLFELAESLSQSELQSGSLEKYWTMDMYEVDNDQHCGLIHFSNKHYI